MQYSTYKVAEMTGVTLRTLRYYDKIGLLSPSHRSQAGYRMYNDDELETLQQIMFFKELDFSLAKISEILKAPNFDRQQALEMQIEFLKNKSERYAKLSQLAQKTLSSMKGEIKMENQDLFSEFDYDKMMQEQKKYEDEVVNRWGDTDAYKISKKRTAKYSKEDWEEISKHQQENTQKLVDCFKSGAPSDSSEARAVVEEARMLIDKYFYPCAPEMMTCLGEMYVSDHRFKETYDNLADGLAVYYNDAIQACYNSTP